MKKLLFMIPFFVAIAIGYNVHAEAIETYRVKPGDSLWKIAVKYEVGLSEIINANPQLKNPNLIYPNQRLQIPLKASESIIIEEEIVKLVNAERSKAGIPPVLLDWQLSRVAKAKAEDMKGRGYFSHNSPTYGDPFKMMRSFGIKYTSAGENIACGQTSARQVMNDWMNSKGHRENILNRNFNKLGVGKVDGGSCRTYWVQMFIKG